MPGTMASTQPTIHKAYSDIRAKISRKTICQSLDSKICFKQFLKLSKIFRQRLWNKNSFRRYTKIYRHLLSKHFENALPRCLEMVHCHFFYLTPTRNMFAGKLVKWLRFLTVLREYIFYNGEWVEVRKISKGFWAKLYCKMIDIFF